MNETNNEASSFPLKLTGEVYKDHPRFHDERGRFVARATIVEMWRQQLGLPPEEKPDQLSLPSEVDSGGASEVEPSIQRGSLQAEDYSNARTYILSSPKPSQTVLSTIREEASSLWAREASRTKQLASSLGYATLALISSVPALIHRRRHDVAPRLRSVVNTQSTETKPPEPWLPPWAPPVAPPKEPLAPKPRPAPEDQSAMEAQRVNEARLLSTNTYRGKDKPNKKRLLAAGALIGALVAGICVYNITSDGESESRPAAISVEITVPVVTTLPETPVSTLEDQETEVPTTTTPDSPAEEPAVDTPSPAEDVPVPPEPTRDGDGLDNISDPIDNLVAPAVRMDVPEVIPDVGEPATITIDTEVMPWTYAENLGVKDINGFLQQVLDEYNTRYGRYFTWDHSDGMYWEGNHVISPSELYDYYIVMLDLYGDL